MTCAGKRWTVPERNYSQSEMNRFKGFIERGNTVDIATRKMGITLAKGKNMMKKLGSNAARLRAEYNKRIGL